MPSAQLIDKYWISAIAFIPIAQISIASSPIAQVAIAPLVFTLKFVMRIVDKHQYTVTTIIYHRTSKWAVSRSLAPLPFFDKYFTLIIVEFFMPKHIKLSFCKFFSTV